MKPKPLDYIIIILLLIIPAILIFLPKDGGESVRITTNDGVYLYSLSNERILSFEGPLGTTIVEIKDGKARITSSPCPGKSCMRATVDKAGDAAVCLPNAISVSIPTKGYEGDVDAISY